MTANGVNDPGEVPELDQDNPTIRATLARLAGNLAGQLSTAAGDIDAALCTPWQAAPLFGRLERVRVEVDYLRKELGRLRPPPGDDDERRTF